MTRHTQEDDILQAHARERSCEFDHYQAKKRSCHLLDLGTFALQRQRQGSRLESKSTDAV